MVKAGTGYYRSKISDHSQSWKRGDGKDHCDIDVAIAIDHMTLAAAEEGLGTCWIVPLMLSFVMKS